MSYPSKFVEFFGPSTWKALHSIAWNYAEDSDAPTDQEKKDLLDFFRILENLLPCPQCRTHYGAYLLKHPIDASNRSVFTHWLHDLHNDVNRRTNKPLLSYEQHEREYSGWDAKTAARFQTMTREQQVRTLGDPHFKEHTWSYFDSVIVVTGALIFGGAVGATLARRKQDK